MSSPRRQRPLWLRDLVTPRSVEYLLLIQDRSVSFVRMCGRGRMEEVIRAEGCGGDLAPVQSFLRALPRHPLYYGQPFAILLHHGSCYTYLHLLDSGSGQQLAQKARFLEDDATRFTQEVRKIGSRHLFIGQGVDREYHDGLLVAIDAVGLPVVSISTLAAQIARRASLPSKPILYVLELFDGEQAYLISDGRGLIGFGALPEAGEDIEPREWGRFLGPEVDPEIVTCVIQADRSQRTSSTHILGPLLRSGGTRRRDQVPSAKRGMFLQRLVNVTKLLTLILISVALLSVIAAVGLRWFMQSGEGPIDEYQQEYSRHLTLTAVADSLTREIAWSRTAVPSHQVSAPWVAFFCRERLPRLYLNRLEITHGDASSTRIQARGAADRESQVFRYLDMLKQEGHPWELHSMAPEVVTVNGRPDTVQSFTLRLEGGTHGP